MAVGHVSFFQNLFAGMTDESGAGYLNWNPNEDWGGKSGFRLDFVIYSAMPVIMGYYVKFKYQLEDKLYDTMLNILLVYPCYAIGDETHPLVLIRKKVVLLHLAFTLFMAFIYYA